MSDATPMGVSEDRLNLLEEIAAQGAPEEEIEELPEEEETEQEDEREEETGEEEEPEEEEPQEEKIEIVVDGQKQTVPLSQIRDAGIRALQKESSADKRLEEATKLKRELEELREQLSPKQVQEIKQGTQSKADAPDLKEVVRAIQFGTEEEAAQALSQLVSMQQGTQQAIPQEQILQSVSQQVNQELRLAAIKQKFNGPPEQGGFGDLTTDERLYNLAVQESNRLIQQGANPLDWRVYEEAGNAVRAWRDSFAPKMQEKKAKKEKIETISGVTAKNTPPAKPKELTVSETIAEMRKTRGL